MGLSANSKLLWLWSKMDMDHPSFQWVSNRAAMEIASVLLSSENSRFCCTLANICCESFHGCLKTRGGGVFPQVYLRGFVLFWETALALCTEIVLLFLAFSFCPALCCRAWWREGLPYSLCTWQVQILSWRLDEACWIASLEEGLSRKLDWIELEWQELGIKFPWSWLELVALVDGE